MSDFDLTARLRFLRRGGRLDARTGLEMGDR